MLSPEDITTIEQAGRRCAVCHTGRHWRRFEVVRPEAGEPMVLCPACRARVGDSLPTSAPTPGAAASPPPARSATPAPQAQAQAPADGTPATQAAPAATPASPPREDRVKRVLRELPPGEYSTGRIAKAAGLNHGKVLARLHSLEEAGEVRQIGKRWSTERPPTDLEEAMDRLQARTGNLRIVRERERVG